MAGLSARRLEVLDLSVDAIHRDLINGTGSLIELGLVRCSLKTIGNNTFSNHARLERLDLSQNQLTVLTQVRKKLCTFLHVAAQSSKWRHQSRRDRGQKKRAALFT